MNSFLPILRDIRNILGGIGFLLASAYAQEPVRLDSLFAPSIGMEKKFAVLLPHNFSNERRYPVLYLLHGHSGGYRDWVERTAVREYVENLPLIVVMPDADNSWYVNSAGVPSHRYEDYVMKDLRHAVTVRYPVDTTKQAIAGLSMGGYGALLFGMKHPGIFRFAASFSGAFLFPRFLGDTVLQPVSSALKVSLEKAFGPAPQQHHNANDVFDLLARSQPDSLPYIYLATGIQDGFKSFLRMHRAFADSLRARNVSYEYHEAVGGHDWKFWDRELKRMLPRLREMMKF